MNIENPSLLFLEKKIIEFQKELILQSQSIQTQEKTIQDLQTSMALDLIEVLDSMSSIFDHLREKEAQLEKPALKAINNFRAIERKIIRILDSQEVSPISFPNQQAIVGLCKIVETVEDPDKPDGFILKILKSGYQRKTTLLRPAEVITVKNTFCIEQDGSRNPPPLRGRSTEPL